MPVPCWQAATTSSEPRSQHGVVVQTCSWYLPDRLSVEHQVEGRDLVDADRRHRRAVPPPRPSPRAAPRRCRCAPHLALRDITAAASPRSPAGPADISRSIFGDLRLALRVEREAASAARTLVGVCSSAMRYLSISPNTMSSEPMIATTSASMWPLRHHVDRLQMREPGRADLAAIRPVGAVGDQIDAELALRRSRPRCRSRPPARGSPR